MNQEVFRALTPWSFFLPIVLAVALGVLVAHGLLAMFSGAGDSDSAQQVRDADGEADGKTHTPNDASAAGVKASAASGSADDAADMDGKREAKVPVALQPVRLPGPSAARRDGQSRACIGGTIAVRASNGWEQEVVNDAPARCIAASL